MSLLSTLDWGVIAIYFAILATVVVAIGLDNICNGLGTAAFMAFLLALCKKRFSATQYALFTSASSILGHSVGASSGYLITAVGWLLLGLPLGPGAGLYLPAPS